jgi:hypothetical protein
MSLKTPVMNPSACLGRMPGCLGSRAPHAARYARNTCAKTPSGKICRIGAIIAKDSID